MNYRILKLTQYGRRRFISHSVAIGFIVLGLSAKATETGAFTLVTGEEYAEALTLEATQEAPAEFITKNQHPSIVVEAPELNGDALNSPIDIVIRFQTSEGETIDMSSLQIIYGSFIDVTDRILENAEVGDDYVRAHQAELPRGNHKLIIIIEDSAGREAEQYITVRVA